MTGIYTPEIAEFVEQELASGEFTDESALVNQALQFYRELKLRHGDLKQHIGVALDQADQGQVSPLDIDEIVSELEEELDETGQPR